MGEKYNKSQKAKITVFILSIFVILFSVTYAFITQVLTGTKEVVVSAGVLDLVLEEENAITISDALPMYDEVGMIQDEVFVFRLVNKTSNPTNYVLKMAKIVADNELQPSDVKYYLTKEGVGEAKLLSTLPLDGTVDSGTIAGDDTIDYALRLWIDSEVTTNEVIAGKTLSYRIDIEVGQEIVQALSPISIQPFDNNNLGVNCKTHDDGVNTFLVGQCSQNYVWYSGKLWRVVLKNNETGAVKMVTDNAITVIPYNEAGNPAFENSYVEQWLNQEFLPTLHDAQDYLVMDSVWDVKENSSNTPSRPLYTSVVTVPVGLLNKYEYYTTYSKSDNLATESTGYLNTGLYWWLITPASSASVSYVYNNGLLQAQAPANANGVRPSVNLKSTVQIKDGKGTQSEPYILEGDTKELVNGSTLLSTRYSGEYISFNDELYRIVDIENGLTKITAVDKPSSFSSNPFHSAAEVLSFSDSSINTVLENYYQGLSTSNVDAYNMIEPNTTWYLGFVGDNTTYNYKSSICADVDANTSMNACDDKAASIKANIGLPRLGEMFTTQLTRGKITSFWTLTQLSTLRVWRFYSDGSFGGGGPKSSYGARPSMYLKSNVVIAKDNTGNGTYEHPYSIEQ